MATNNYNQLFSRKASLQYRRERQPGVRNRKPKENIRVKKKKLLI
jgi:hypothetical protein